jgi:hypothetical protein
VLVHGEIFGRLGARERDAAIEPQHRVEGRLDVQARCLNAAHHLAEAHQQGMLRDVDREQRSV